MYENISGLLDLTAPQFFKIAIVGEAKAGKTNLALSFPGSIFHMDFDTRFESVKEYVQRTKRTDIRSKTYTDLNPAIPVAVTELEKDLSMFEYDKSMGRPIPETYVLDSITFLRAYCEHELMKQEPKFSRKIKLGNNTLLIAQGWDIINGNRGYLEYLIGRFSALGNVIAIFHELDEKDNQKSTKEEKRYTGRKTIQPQYLSTLLSIFNDVFRVTLDYSGKRVIQTQPNSEFMASTTMKLEEFESIDLAQMIAKDKKARGV
jgi:GTPase SAR1 family protein